MNNDMTVKAIALITSCTDANKLRQMAKNAREQGNIAVERAASLRSYEVLPSEEPGTLEHDVWRSIHALEHSLSTERGKTIRLSRTRNSIAAIGEKETLARLLMKSKPSDGFAMLIDRDMAERTFEAVALRHQDRFDNPAIEAARSRLAGVGQLPSEA